MSELAPHNTELERSVLGAILTAPEQLGEIAAILKPADFFEKRHRIIFQAMLAMNGRVADPLTLGSFLESKGTKYLDAAGGESYLIDLLVKAPSYLLAPQHAHEVARIARQRRIVEATGKIAQLAHKGELDAAQEEARKLADAERAPGRGWEVRTLADAYQDKGPRRYAIGGLFPIPSLSVLYGPSGDLKSMILLDAGLSIAAGLPWLEGLPDGPDVQPYKVEQSPVLWIDADQGADELERRIKALGSGRDIPDTNPFCYVTFPSPAFVASNQQAVGLVLDTVRAIGAQVVIIDNLGTVSGGADENSTQMVGVMHGLKQIAELGGCAVIVIHHQVKGERKGGESMRGSTSIMAALSVTLQVIREEDVLSVIPWKSRAAPVQPFAALWTYEQDSQGELERGRFFGLGKPENRGLSKQEQAELCILKDMRDGMNQSEIVDLVKQNAEVGRHNAIAAIKSLESQGKLYARVGARGAIEYDRR